jgi:hypothetical protein
LPTNDDSPLEVRLEVETAEKRSPPKKKVKKTEIISLKKSSDSDTDSCSTISSNEDRNNLSIVRFNSNVCMRRISTDEGGGSGGNLFEVFGSRISEMRRNTIVEAFELESQSQENEFELNEEGLYLRRSVEKILNTKTKKSHISNLFLTKISKEKTSLNGLLHKNFKET